ncbi:MAG: hypothetical protein JNJ59_25935 [Deltaproteobacteria bacterium]|nr:hypothetical protein [Deltaproteobacteria bacterium]
MAYLPNPGATVDPLASGVEGLTLVAPVPGRGLVRSIWAATDPLFMAALGLMGQTLPLGLDAASTERLVAAGLLLEATSGTQGPRFRPTVSAAEGFVPCPRPRALASFGRLGAVTDTDLEALFGDDLAWATDPRTGFALPFAPSASPPEAGHPDLDFAAPLVAEIGPLGEAMRRDGFVHLPPLFGAALPAAGAAYYEALAQSGGLGFDARTRRLSANDEALGVFWHRAFTPLLERVVGEPVCATFSYVAAYVDDAVLPPHTDRDACTWTLSWMLAEETAGGDPWPLWVRDLHGVDHALPLRPGEGALMRGQELVHWRDPIGPGRRATLLIFCWVPASEA